MKNIKAHIRIAVRPTEILQVLCEEVDLPRLLFQLEGQAPVLSTGGACPAVVDFSEVCAFRPEVGRMLLQQYVSQKLESIPLPKKSPRAWLQAFELGDKAAKPLADLSQQAQLRLKLLVSVLSQHHVLVLRSTDLLDDATKLLWDIKSFLLRLKNPLLRPAFVFWDTDTTPRWIFSMERILAEENGVVEDVSVVI